jgi:hypothetical protein
MLKPRASPCGWHGARAGSAKAAAAALADATGTSLGQAPRA